MSLLASIGEHYSKVRFETLFDEWLKRKATEEPSRYQVPSEGVTQESYWKAWLATGKGEHEFWDLSDVDLCAFLNDPQGSPWGRQLSCILSKQKTPRVLVTGTSAEVRELREKKALKVLRGVCRSRGVTSPTFTFCARIAMFWEAFFGRENFLTVKPADIPALVLATGFMRYYGPCGGMTWEAGKRLEEIGKAWGIPVVPIPSTAI